MISYFHGSQTIWENFAYRHANRVGAVNDLLQYYPYNLFCFQISSLEAFCCRFHVHGLWIQDSSFVNILPTSVSPTPSVSVKFKGHCALLCQRDSTCKGFFYNEGSEECIKTPSVFLRNGDELSVPGSRYYRSTPGMLQTTSH